MSDETTELAREDWADRRLVPVGVRMPAGYSISYSGVWVEKQFGKEIVNVRVAWAPLVIKAVYVDPAGDQAVELAWVDRGQVVTRTVQRSVVRRGRILVATLGDAGLPVIEADAKLAERYLAAFESINQGKIPRVHLARQLGWQKDGTFVTAQDTPHRVEVKFDEQKPALAAHAPAGTFAGWQAAVKPMEAYPAAQMALYASLAAPLLELVGVNSFTVDISGRSTRGKTTAAGAGMSVWADPSEKADGMYSWRTTMLAAEKRLNLVNGLPVVFDETKLVRDPELVHALLYSIPKNHGQARGGGWPSGLPWRTVMISTGEQSVLTFTTDQGAGARVLTVKEAPFGTDGPESATAAVDVRDGCAEHYGTAGPRFVEKLLEETTGDGKRRLVARHKELTGTTATCRPAGRPWWPSSPSLRKSATNGASSPSQRRLCPSGSGCSPWETRPTTGARWRSTSSVSTSLPTGVPCGRRVPTTSPRSPDGSGGSWTSTGRPRSACWRSDSRKRSTVPGTSWSRSSPAGGKRPCWSRTPRTGRPTSPRRR